MNSTVKKSTLTRWALWAGNHPGKAILIALVITLILTLGASKLEMEMTFLSIMPKNSPQVQNLDKITKEFPFASSLVLVVDGRELPPETAKATVISLIDRLTVEFSSEEFSSGISGVYSKADVDFIKKHGFLLAEKKDLDRMTSLYADTDLVPFLSALNNDLEREYSGDGEALEDDESQIVSWTEGIGLILDNLAGTMEGLPPDEADIEAALEAYLIGSPYYLSRSENMGLMFLKPTFTINDLGPLMEETTRIEERAQDIAASKGAGIGLTGIAVVGRDEMISSEQGFALSMLIAFILILALMIVVFRIRSTPLIIGIPLMLGIYWTAGITGFLIHRLNIVTAMYLVVLVGLGVDYAIHLMTGFIQERDKGKNFSVAIENTFTKSGRGIIIGALTTAAAFFAMLMADSEILKELGIVAGTGILAELISMLILIPALLGMRQKRLEKRSKDDPMLSRNNTIRSDFASVIGRWVSSRPGTFTVAFLIIGVALATQAPKVQIEDNLMNMEAKGLESIKYQDLMVDEFGTAPDILYLIKDNDSIESLPPEIDKLKKLDSVKSVGAITDWQPTDTQQSERLPYLKEIRENLAAAAGSSDTPSPDPDLLTEELYRLEANLIEMGDLAVLGGTDKAAFALNKVTGLDNDGNKVADTAFDRLFNILEAPTAGKSADAETTTLSDFQAVFSPRLRNRILAMSSSEKISAEDLPDLIRDTFISKDGKSNLVTISPRENPWNGQFRRVFNAQVSTVTDQSTGMILAADQLSNIAEHDSIRALIAALIAVFIILLADFRNLRLTLLTFLPLLFSFTSLYGLMALFGIKFDFVNIIAAPLLVGIGIDDSVHINHRYLMEGRGRMNLAISETGSAVALTTITTMIGFSSFIPSIMRAMRSTGIVLTLAMALAFIYSVFLHPAVLILVSEKLGWNLNPSFFKKEVSHHEA